MKRSPQIQASVGPGGILVTYDGAPAALVGVRQMSFLGEIRHFTPGHPTVRVVTYMAHYAGLVLAGELPGPYTDEDAERFTRLALIDPDQLARLADRSHEAVAAQFRVPVGQVQRARAELRW
jgi:hypothetical protein